MPLIDSKRNKKKFLKRSYEDSRKNILKSSYGYFIMTKTTGY
ncbi:unnamed protein product [Moneuplotes crassus]|uniref:Uncharacterized protein n=1 Tax=Euplotes crassus TaxID=5936 RepID=A0AAD1XT81_EUPCR|nr:unnamed protein product [Moneuplotes crassus]